MSLRPGPLVFHRSLRAEKPNSHDIAPVNLQMPCAAASREMESDGFQQSVDEGVVEYWGFELAMRLCDVGLLPNAVAHSTRAVVTPPPLTSPQRNQACSQHTSAAVPWCHKKKETVGGPPPPPTSETQWHFVFLRFVAQTGQMNAGSPPHP